MRLGLSFVPVLAGFILGVDAQSSCNGNQALCSLRYDQVTYAGTHNSGAVDLKFDCHNLAKSCRAGRILCGGFEKICDGVVPDKIEDCLWQNNDVEVEQQLADGIRIFDLDTCLKDDGSVVNCHGFGTTRALGKPLLATFQSIANYLSQNRNEVVTLTFGDHDGDTTKIATFIKNGLQTTLGKWLVEKNGAWPTLGEMVRSDKRVVIMMARGLENAGGRPSWVMSYDELIDDPYFPVLEDDDRPERLEESYLNNWCLRDPTKLSKLQVVDATISLQLPQLEADLKKLKFPTRICYNNLAHSVNYNTLERISDFCSSKLGYIYRVRVDYHRDSKVIDVVRKLNERNVKVFGGK